MKKCYKCKLEKEVGEFYKNKTKNKDGFQSYCKSCYKQYFKTVYEKKLRKYNKEYSRTWYLKNRKKHIKKVNERNQILDNGLFTKYLSMKRRCNYDSLHNHKYYIGKGIKVEWKSYQDFKKDMSDSYLLHVKIHGKKQTTLDRINSNKNYCKENCRWATYKVQANREMHFQ